MSRYVWTAAVSLAFAWQWSASAATLHEPLPPDSTAVNGTVQHMHEHSQLRTVETPLPNKGLHPHAEAGLKRVYTGAPIDTLNYHYDTYPTGWNQSEMDLTPSTVGSRRQGAAMASKKGGSLRSTATSARVLIGASPSSLWVMRATWEARTSVTSSVGAVKCGPPSNGSTRQAYRKPTRRSIFSTQSGNFNANDPGDRRAGFDFNYRIPGLRLAHAVLRQLCRRRGIPSCLSDP